MPARFKLPWPLFVLALTILTLSLGGPLNQAQAAPGANKALLLMGKPISAPQKQILSLKPRPASTAVAGLSQTFNQRDHYTPNGVTRKREGADIFLGMDRQISEDADSWKGSAGLQINW